MKRNQLLRHLHRHHCLLFREGKRHSIFHHAATRRTSSVPRHREIDDFLVEKICKDLGIQPVK